MTLHGGPLDDQQTEVEDEDPDPGVAMISDWGAYGPGGRSCYSPDEHDRWTWQGDPP